MVVDEGHTTSNVATTINYFVQQLSIQHKWIVTGTPTSNILGLQLGRTTDEEESNPDYPDPDLPVAMSPSQDCQGEVSHRRIWGDYDRGNLRSLAKMIGNFLAVPQFRAASDPRCFKLHVLEPLCGRRGPRPGAINVLSQVMQMVMVRHR